MGRVTEVPRGERMARVYAFLIRNRKRKFTAADIVAEFGDGDRISLRNAQRDLKALAEARGTSVIGETIEGRKRYSIEEDMRGRISLPLPLNGLLAFFLLKRLQPFFAPKARTLEELSEAVIDRVAKSDYEFFDDLDEKLDESAVFFDRQSPLAVDDSMFNDLLTSLVKRRKIKILYQKAHGERPEEKVICPAKLVYFKSELYFICMSEYNKSHDFYIKLCRIESATLLKETFTPDPERITRIEKRLTESFGIMDRNVPKPQKVVVRFPPGPYYRRIFAEKRYHVSQQVSTDKKGNTIVTLNAPVGLDLINWVLEWPESVVLEPKELRKEMLVVAETLKKKYGKKY